MIRQIFLAIIFSFAAFVSHKAQQKEIIAYFPEWSARNQYYVKNIETSGAADKITVINYAFCVPAPDSTGTILPMFLNPYFAYRQFYTSDMSIDGAADDSTQALRGQFNQLKKLKARHPQIRLLISIGGWTGSSYISDAALTAASREKFVDAVIDLYILGNLPVNGSAGGTGAAAGVFDGIDIDWEYPIFGGIEEARHSEKDNDNLTELFKLFRAKLDAINPKLLLTAAIPGIMPYAGNYNLKDDQKYVDWYSIMTYDFTGGWNGITNHHTNLFSSAKDTSEAGAYFSFDYSVKLFRDTFGVSPDKLIPGAAFYGRGWVVNNTANGGIGQQGSLASGVHESGFNYYSHLKKMFANDSCTLYWDMEAMAPYYFCPAAKEFWTLDDEQSIVLKSQYADAYGLRGMMFWDICGDDSIGTLVNAIYTRNMPNADICDSSFSPLSLKIKLLADSAKYYAGDNIIVSAEAEGSIARIEFFIDGKSIGCDTREPFNWVWFNAKPGKHEIKAEAVSFSGGKAVSAKTSITIE